jgi:D-threo-aldose 1-dehydrogenase
MIFNELGKTGIKIPPVIFGTSALGNLYVALDEDTKLSIIKECVTHVDNPVVFDCAGKYGAGLALEMLGSCLQKLHIPPDNVVISNKLGWTRVPLKASEPTFEPGVWHNLKFDAEQHISYDGIIACWEQGNELLGGLYKPQLVSVHDPDEYVSKASNPKEKQILFGHILDAYRALSDLKKKGKVKAVGVGAKKWKIIEQISKYIDLDWVMFANSMTIMHHPPELLNFMKQLENKGVGIINSAVFHGGFLTGGSFFDYVLIKPDTPENIARFKWRENFYSLCKEYGISPAAACVKFAMSPPGVLAISLNTSKPDRVKDNVESVMAEIPEAFWHSMKEKGLIRNDYPYVAPV